MHGDVDGAAAAVQYHELVARAPKYGHLDSTHHIIKYMSKPRVLSKMQNYDMRALFMIPYPETTRSSPSTRVKQTSAATSTTTKFDTSIIE